MADEVEYLRREVVRLAALVRDLAQMVDARDGASPSSFGDNLREGEAIEAAARDVIVRLEMEFGP